MALDRSAETIDGLLEIFGLGYQAVVDELPENVEDVGDQHELTGIELHHIGVGQQFGALNGNFQGFHSLIGFERLNEFVVQLFDSRNVLLLRQVQHLMR